MTTNTEKRRAGFEAWVADKYEIAIPVSHKKPNGDYWDEYAQFAWQAYNAALDSVCVELPDSWGAQTSEYKGELIALLERDGIPYK